MNAFSLIDIADTATNYDAAQSGIAADNATAAFEAIMADIEADEIINETEFADAEIAA